MFCEKCGSQIAPGERFCGNCGAPVAAAPVQPVQQQTYTPAPQPPYAPQPAAQQPYPQQGYAPQFSGQQPAPKKKKNKKAAIFAAIGAVIVAVGIFVGVAFATGLFGSSETQVAKLEKKSVHKVMEAVSDVVDVEAIKEGASYSVEIKPGPALSTYLQGSGMDLSWLSSLKLDISGEDQESCYAGSATLSLNGTELATLKVMIDYEAGQIKLGVDGLSDSYTAIDMSSITALLGNMTGSLGQLDDIVDSLDDLVDVSDGIPSMELLAQIDFDRVIDVLEKYIGMVIDSFETVETTNGSITANGVTEQCDVYTTSVSMKQMFQIVQKLVDKLADDGDVKNMLKDFYPLIEAAVGEESDFDTFYSQFKQMIDSARESLSTYEQYIDESIPLFTLVTYGDGDDLIGFSLQVYSNGEPAFDTFFGVAHSDSNFGLELAVNGERYLLGSGTKNGSAVSGDIQLVINGTPLVNMKLTGFDADAKTGTIEFSLSSEALSRMNVDSSMASVLSVASIKIDFTDTRTVFDLLLGGQSLVQMTAEQTAKQPVLIDANAPTVDPEQWAQTLDVSGLISRLRSAGVPSEYVEMLEGSSSALH